MSRPLTVAIVFYVIGIVTCYYFKFEISLLVCLGAYLLFTGIYKPARTWGKTRHAAYVLLLLLGLALSCWETDRNRGNIESLAGRKVVLVGTVCREPDVRRNAVNYTVKVEDELTGEFQGRSLRGTALVSIREPGPRFSYGDRLRIKGVPEIPPEAGNPGDFNYKKYLLRKGIQLIVNSRQGAGLTKIGTGRVNPFVDFCIKLKNKFMLVLESTLSPQHAALMEGILFGSCGRIDNQLRDDFALTGVVHILSVSGFHVGLVAAFCVFCGNALGLSRVARNVLLVVVTFIYAVMTGASPPVIRAVIMAWVLLLSDNLGKTYDWPSSMSLAALIILALSPHSLFTAGFQLSFTATWGILYITPVLQRAAFLPVSRVTQFLPSVRASGFVTTVGRTIAITLAAQIAVLPIVAYYYHYFSVISVAANLVIVPLVSVAMLLGAFAGLTGILWLPLGETVGLGLGIILDFILKIARLLAGISFAAVTIEKPSLLKIALFYFLVILVAEAVKKPRLQLKLGDLWTLYGRKIVIAFLLIATVLLWTGIVYPGAGELEVTFLDIGQGDAILIRSPRGRVIVLDTGGIPKTGQAEYDPGEKILAPYLRRLGISRVDMLLLSHPHDDHIQGARSLLKSMSISMLVTAPQFHETPLGAELISHFMTAGIDIKKVSGGERILFGENIIIEVLSPPDGVITDENNDSLVARLCFGDFHILFTGDAEEPALQRLVYGSDSLHAEVVKVPHHGSKNAWLESFYRAVDPKLAVISVGKNSFGHPSGRVIEELSRLGIQVYRTDKHGAITIRSDGHTFQVESVRTAN